MDRVSSSELLIDDLLEDYWFFENLFTTRSKVLRYCHSDPYPSSSSSSSSTTPEKMGDLGSGKILEASTERFSISEPSIDRIEAGSQTKLTRQFSEKIRVQERRNLQKKEPMFLPKSGSRSAPSKIQEASVESCLIRAPSLPPQIEKREVDYEAKKMINKLTRQFSEKIRILEPTRSGDEPFLQKKEVMFRDKGISKNPKRNNTGSSSSSSSSSSSNTVKICLQRTQTMPNNIRREDEFEDQESDSRMGFLIREAIASSHNVPKVSSNQIRHRPPRNLRSEETVMVKQGSSSPKTLRKTLSSIETVKEIERLKGCYDQLIEPRDATGVATPPRVPKDSRKEMKDQIKFWARAVASNVRQEC